MAKQKPARIKKAVSAAKKKAPKQVATKVKKVAAKTKRVAAKAKTVVKAKAKRATTTMGTVREKAHKLADKLHHVQHDAVDVAMRIGSTMESIGGALKSLVTPGDATKTREKA